MSSAQTHPRVQETNDPTREKLLEAAGQVFAEHGYQAATVREICALAGANVAAVNYHFGDKLGLYNAVLRHSIGSTGQSFWEQADLSQPEKTLFDFIHVMLRRMNAGERPSWAFRIMAHEMAQPTPALAQVIDEVIRPNYERLCGLLGTMLGLPATNETTRFFALSVIGQVTHHKLARPVISVLVPKLTTEPKDIERVARHIADFSLGAVHAYSKRIKENE